MSGSVAFYFDPLDKTLTLRWGSYWDGSPYDPEVGPATDVVSELNLVIEEQPSADYRD
jgi:hypothetical protein